MEWHARSISNWGGMMSSSVRCRCCPLAKVCLTAVVDLRVRVGGGQAGPEREGVLLPDKPCRGVCVPPHPSLLPFHSLPCVARIVCVRTENEGGREGSVDAGREGVRTVPDWMRM